MNRPKEERKLGATRIAVALAVTISPVTACGGDGDAVGTAPSTSTPAPPSTTTAAPPSTVDPAEVELVAWCIANAPVAIEGPTEEIEREMAEELAEQGAAVVPPAEIREAFEIYRRNAGPESSEWRRAASEIDRFWAANCGDYVELGTKITQP